MPLSHFDEISGIIAAETSWGRWWQTVSEVFVEVNIPPDTRGKDCQVIIKSNFIECRVRGTEVFKGPLYKTVRAEESTWTVEERKRILILLEKAEKFDNRNLWVSLMIGQNGASPIVQQEMLKKLELEKFQIENPGFDFSRAELSKSYDNPPFIPGVADEDCS